MLQDYSNRGFGMAAALVMTLLLVALLGALPKDTLSSEERVVEVMRLLPEVAPPPPPASEPEAKEEPRPQPEPATEAASREQTQEVDLKALEHLLADAAPTETAVPVTETPTRRRSLQVQTESSLDGFEMLETSDASGSFSLDVPARKSDASAIALQEGNVRFDVGDASRKTLSSGETANVKVDRRAELAARIQSDAQAWREAVHLAMDRLKTVRLPATILEHIAASGQTVRYLKQGSKEFYIVWDARNQQLKVLVVEGSQVFYLVGTPQGPSRYRKGRVSLQGGVPTAIETVEQPPAQAATLYREVLNIIVNYAS